MLTGSAAVSAPMAATIIAVRVLDAVAIAPATTEAIGRDRPTLPRRGRRASGARTWRL